LLKQQQFEHVDQIIGFMRIPGTAEARAKLKQQA